MARILVVDDQKISRLTLAGILGDAGHEVRAEGSGEAGLASARSWMPDVVVLDVHMPEMDGFEVVARLKEDPVTESIPVVFLTGDPPTDELVVRGLELGAYDFLSKGCSKAELLARVSVMDRIKRSHDELSAIAQISDALLRSVDPETLARQFIAEARNVFRADAAVLAIERRGDAKVRVWDGLDVEDGVVVAMLKAVGSEFGEHDTAESRILDGDDVARVIEPHLGDRFNTCGIACVRRDPSTALVVVLAEQPRLLRGDVDGPLLKNLSSQAAIAIEHALLNERARQQAEDLERAMTERSRFFASLSHELRTPINAVIGYNHLLQEKIFGQLSDRQSEALEKANRSAQHLLELVDDILDISKIEAGKLEIFPESTDLAALIRDTATSLQLQAKEKAIDLAVDAPDRLRVETDPARVRQVVLNLLSNAVKFTDEGRVDLRVDRDPSGMARIRVSDTGPGIAPEDQARIFEEFEQARTGGGSSGTGLGLAISRRLAELLGGRLELESEVGVGSTFTFALPERSPPQSSDGDWSLGG
jgi:signal transduction histidine kinase/DNA-binding response OmpR family regulator